MPDLTAITLDAAGTLIQVREPVGETYARLANAHGIAVDADTVSRAFRTVFPRMSPLAFGASDPDRLRRQERDWWRTLVRNCLGALGQHPSFSSYFDDLYGYYASPSAWSLYPEVTTTLDALDAAGLRLAVVSNFDTRLHGILDGLGIGGRFEAVLCSSEAGAAKPGAKIFHAACAVFGCAPEQVLHAGDDRRADFDGALAAGLRARWLRRGGSEPDADRVIKDLSALADPGSTAA